MKLDELDAAIMKKAVDVYLDVAFEPDQTRRPTVQLEGTGPELLERFVSVGDPGDMRRYVMRLGNARYPFMKMVFQELLVRDFFFFAVDTHDDLAIRDGFPDYDAWLEVKRYNTEVKENVERRWREAGLPTMASVIAAIEDQTPAAPAPVSVEAPLIVAADDEAELLRGMTSVLSGAGYRVKAASSAEEALELIERETPDVVVSDLEMGGMSGLDFARRLREHPATERVPFILVTAANVAGLDLKPIDGFLAKPYPTQDLLDAVSRHTGTAGETESRP